MGIDNLSNQMATHMQETAKVKSTHYAFRTSSKGKVSTSTGKISKMQVNPFATLSYAISLEGFKKRKYLKSTI